MSVLTIAIRPMPQNLRQDPLDKADADLKLNDKQIRLLDDLIEAQESNPAGVNYLTFQIAHEENLMELDHLRTTGLIEQRDKTCFLRLFGLSVIATSNPVAKTHLMHCGAVFDVVGKRFRTGPEQTLLVSDVARSAGLTEPDGIRALIYLRDAPIWGGYSTDLTKFDSYVIAGPSILRYKTLESVLDTMRQWTDRNEREANNITVPTADVEFITTSGEGVPSAYLYVNVSRLEDLRTLKGKWDFSRLCRLCEELNTNYQNECFLATAMLVRAILDHVAPAFGCKKFSEIYTVYEGQRSFKETMQRLNAALRSIADGHLHSQLRAADSLPTRNQVEFRAELDLLLGELVCVQRGNSGTTIAN